VGGNGVEGSRETGVSFVVVYDAGESTHDEICFDIVRVLGNLTPTPGDISSTAGPTNPPLRVSFRARIAVFSEGLGDF
jgi:hypothetical protein